MTINELIERLKALPKDVRRRPLMDGKPAVGYRLAPLDHISVEKVLASNDGFCGMTDPELTDAENVAEAGAEESVANCADYDGREIGECELRLHDGRRVTCAVLSGFRKGGLSCDWANAAKTNGKAE